VAREEPRVAPLCDASRRDRDGANIACQARDGGDSRCRSIKQNRLQQQSIARRIGLAIVSILTVIKVVLTVPTG